MLWVFSAVLLAPSAIVLMAAEDGKANPAPKEPTEPLSKQRPTVAVLIFIDLG